MLHACTLLPYTVHCCSFHQFPLTSGGFSVLFPPPHSRICCCLDSLSPPFPCLLFAIFFLCPPFSLFLLLDPSLPLIAPYPLSMLTLSTSSLYLSLFHLTPSHFHCKVSLATGLSGIWLPSCCRGVWWWCWVISLRVSRRGPSLLFQTPTTTRVLSPALLPPLCCCCSLGHKQHPQPATTTTSHICRVFDGF